MPRSGSTLDQLYHGETRLDLIGRRRIWYALSLLLVVISIGSLLIRGVNESIDFKGGAVFQAPAHGHSLSAAEDALDRIGITTEVGQTVGSDQLRLQTGSLSETKADDAQRALAGTLGVSENQVAVSTVGPTWGAQVTHKALVSLLIFLVVVLAYLSVRYEPKMAVAAFVALIHDLVITAGIYSLVGFEVAPSTVIALLTILGYSLYDTVVVFDKVKENTGGLTSGSRMTYTQAANLALNQTLMRSINTSIIALLPVASLLFIGSGLLGAGTLEDLALAMLVGLASGAYSSIFLATPLLVDLKEREPAMRALSKRVANRTTRAAAAPAPGAVSLAAAGGPLAAEPAGPAEPVRRDPGVRSQPTRQQPRRPTQRRPSGRKRR